MEVVLFLRSLENYKPVIFIWLFIEYFSSEEETVAKNLIVYILHSTLAICPVGTRNFAFISDSFKNYLNEIENTSNFASKSKLFK